MHENIDVSIVIVTWNSEDEITDCVNSIEENTKDINYEIIIVDNYSSDNTPGIISSLADKFSNLSYYLNKENSGYSRGNNLGISYAKGRNVLLLNPDTKLTDNSVKMLSDKLDGNENYAAIAPKLLNRDGSIQKSCRTFPTYFDMFCQMSLLAYIFPKSRVFNRWKTNYFNHNEETIVSQPMAAALMFRNSFLGKVKGFNVKYYMFFNDVELCKKVYEGGHQILFYPDAKVIHKKGASVYKDREKMIKVWNTDCVEYFKNNFDNPLKQKLLSTGLKISSYFRILKYKLLK